MENEKEFKLKKEEAKENVKATDDAEEDAAKVTHDEEPSHLEEAKYFEDACEDFCDDECDGCSCKEESNQHCDCKKSKCPLCKTGKKNCCWHNNRSSTDDSSSSRL